MTGSTLAVLMALSVAGTMLFLYLGAVLDYFVLKTHEAHPGKSISLTFERPMYLLAAACAGFGVWLFAHAFSVWPHHRALEGITAAVVVVIVIEVYLVAHESLIPKEGRVGYYSQRRR
jgi:peptidoglycan biosynthesis protein MviN/MurJ (putative lipid II flippase)